MRVWRSDDGTVEFEAPEALLESIRTETSLATNGLSLGGVEVGGLLLGKCAGERITVRDWRPIQCEHSKGPTFQLSQNDLGTLSAQIDGLLAGHQTAGNILIGWFISHTRGDMGLRDEERRLHARTMPAHTRLLLVLKPSQFGDVEVSFHRMNGDESIAVPGVLNIDPKPGLHWEANETGGSDDAPAQPRSAKPVFAAFGLAVLLGACGWLGWDLWQRLGPIVMSEAPPPATNPPAEKPIDLLSLRVQKGAGNYVITWDAESAAIASANRVSLTIYDSGEERTRVLSAAELKAGRFGYPRDPASIAARLSVELPSGERRVERVAYPAMDTVAGAR